MILSPAKKIILIAVITFFAHPFIYSQTRFYYFAGPQITTVRYYVHNVKQDVNFKPGFILGAGAKIEFENHLYFSPAVYYSYKGYKVKFDQTAYPPDLTAIDNNTGIHTLETAFLLQYDFSKDPSHFFIKLGPSLDFQLSGHEKFNRVDGSYVSRNMKYDFASYGRYAASAIVHAGYESRLFILSGYYEYGLTDLNNADNGPSIKYRIAGITISRYFK